MDILRICALNVTHPKSTHTAVNTHTHTMNTHPEQWAAIYAGAPGEQLGVRCFAQGPPQSWYWGWRASTVHLFPPPTIPVGSETRTHVLWVTSSTLYTLGHDCPSIWLLPGLKNKKKSHYKTAQFIAIIVMTTCLSVVLPYSIYPPIKKKKKSLI